MRALRQRSRFLGPLRRLTDHPRVLPLTATLLRARTVVPSGRFLIRELAGRRGAFAYPLRSAPGVRVVVRHGRADPVTLGEVFHERDYEPPEALAGLRPRRIVDVGANVGYFGAFVLARWPQAQITAFEPDPTNAAVHERTIALNGAEQKWRLCHAAAATADGELRFRASGDALARLDADGDTIVRAIDVLPLIADADLLKLDAEGGEWPLLSDPRFASSPPAVVVLEYHPEGAPDGAPRPAALRLLAKAGLTESHTVFDGADGYGMVWAWRP